MSINNLGYMYLQTHNSNYCQSDDGDSIWLATVTLKLACSLCRLGMKFWKFNNIITAGFRGAALWRGTNNYADFDCRSPLFPCSGNGDVQANTLPN